jgi:hypothetical protein
MFKGMQGLKVARRKENLWKAVNVEGGEGVEKSSEPKMGGEGVQKLWQHATDKVLQIDGSWKRATKEGRVQRGTMREKSKD